MCVAGFGFGLIDIGEDLLAALQITLARLCQRDAARHAVQQARAQVRLEIGHGARSIGRRGVQMLRRRREAAGFDDAHEDAHVLKRIHSARLGS